MCSSPEPKSLDDFGGDDRVFLTGVAKKLRERRLDMLMLPEASLKLTELLRQGDRPIAEYVSVVSKDASLSIEVLKAANSAFYAGASHTTTLHDAIMRLGLARLQSILMMTSLKARVLKAGRLQGKVDVVLDLALPIGFVASQIAKANKRPTDPCFMRGMLLHVEHLMILGMVNDIAREHRAPLTLSTPAIVQAFARFGPEIRTVVAQAWQLETILLSGTATGDELDYAMLRHVVICKWLGYELPAVPHVAARSGRSGHPAAEDSCLAGVRHPAPRCGRCRRCRGRTALARRLSPV